MATPPLPTKENALPMGPVAAFILIWALLYIPGLGGPEFKGEEPRRVQPAIAMLDSGDWIVPHIGGEVYFNKPPLINWLIAGAYTLCGRSEWSARSVSVLAILAMGLVILVASRSWLGQTGAFVAAVAATTHVSIIDKGRLIEIEGLYIALFSIALVLWISEWKRSSPRGFFLWVLPWLFLGLGLLTKGPLHLLFFYGTIIAVLLFDRKPGALLSPWHAAGVLAGALVVAMWAVPFFQSAATEEVLKTWKGQMGSRIAGEEDRLVSFEWMLNLPKGLGNFLPWVVVLAGLLWALTRRKTASAGAMEPRRIAPNNNALLVSFALFFGLLGLIPGILPRYTMPMFTVAALWIGSTLQGSIEAWIAAFWRQILRALALILACVAAVCLFLQGEILDKAWLLPGIAVGIWLLFGFRPTREPARLVFATALLVSIGVSLYAGVLVPKMNARDDVRPVGAEINRIVGPSGILCAVKPGSRPFIAYLSPELRFAASPAEVPNGTTHLLILEKRFDQANFNGLGWTEIGRFNDRDKDRFVLLSRSGT